MAKKPAPSIAGLPVHAGVRFNALALLDEADAARIRVAHDRDSEALHDFRVALRRLRSWIRSFRPWFDGAVTRADRRRLRTIARATSAARDLEVQLEWLERLAGNAALDAVRSEVRAALDALAPDAEREALRAVHQFPDASGRLRVRLPGYSDRVDRSAPGRFETTAAAAAAQAATLLVELREQIATVTSPSDGREVHDARIAAKRLRYLLEPFRADAPSIAAAIRVLRRIQDDFGDHHDLDVLAGTVRGLGDAARPDGRFAAAATAIGQARDAIFAKKVTGWIDDPGADLGPVQSAIEDLAAAGATPHLEIERKFLLRAMPRRRRNRTSVTIDQGWLPGDRIVERIRRTRSATGTTFTRTIKIGHGLARIEIEEPIDEALFRRLWPLTRDRRLSKRRHRYSENGKVWEIDDFSGRDLVLAELEIDDVHEVVDPPAWLVPWIVREVTGDLRYENRRLAESEAPDEANRKAP